MPITLSNEGKTPAILKKIYAGIKITRDKLTKSKAEHIIKEISFNSMQGSVDIDKREIRNGAVWQSFIPVNDISDSEFREFLNTEPRNINPPNLYCCGKVVYEDIMKKTHITWFCWELKGRNGIISGIAHGIFCRADNEELNDYT